ncbi:protein kinase domain-containing protein [Stackebrandtia nassauensis]|uniref:non-specific serine/threonine protein kinase n=1 Tax=Stackebrandtia nassauensis (strain DSM 44728 / CIP 108903 / NRRL B-16338 / NBRC 102104 / LLR-40K-21) TaxID=446470 RepID=D3PU15_STANL|nr:protein kinase [Stackebrandtia nassauensis]ADD40961.1 serine/threonine protein kinase [Stackebrandtia nassauensis DSM 44728]
MNGELAQRSVPGSGVGGGRYRLDSRIADGGMGEVWRATDTRLGRAVAVKLLHLNYSRNPHFKARFESEARLVASLKSPAIAVLHDYGEDETVDGTRSYLVMELVEGRTLADLLQERVRLPVQRTMRIIAEAADGLEAAHRAGIIHRDVKPGNIIVADDGAIKVVDFGIARALGTAGLTETGVVIGTMRYTSPEQIADQDPTPSVDIYSLGVVAYECLAGQPPFMSENPVAIMDGHVNRKPPPLPDDIPEPVRQVVATALRKNPVDRFDSIADFGQACWDLVERTASRPARSVRVTQEERPALLGGHMSPAPSQWEPEVADDPEQTPVHRVETTSEPVSTPTTGMVAVGHTSPGGTPVRRAAPPSPPRSPRPAGPTGPTGPVKAKGLLRPDRHRRRVARYSMVILVVALVLATATASWNPWGLGIPGTDEATTGPVAAGKSDASSADDHESDKTKSSKDKSSENTPESASGGDAVSSGDDNGGDNADGNDNDDVEKGKVPNLIGQNTFQAPGMLEGAGFKNHDSVGKATGEHGYCVIYDQSPNPDAVVGYKTKVTYYYDGNGPGCGEEN